MNIDLPSDIKQYLDLNIAMVKKFFSQCNSKPDARCSINVKYIKDIDCFIKFGVERVANAIKLRKIIEDNKLDLLCVPDKYLYNIPDTNDYIVVVKRVHNCYDCINNNGINNCISNSTNSSLIKCTNSRGVKLNVNQVNQLYNMCILASYKSLHTLNYIVLQNDKICIIDTDVEAMPNDNNKANLFNILILELKKARHNYNKETYQLFVNILQKNNYKLWLHNRSQKK